MIHRCRLAAICLCCAAPILFAARARAQSEDGFNANQRILRIRELGKRDSRVIPMLTEYLKDPNPDIRIETVKAITKIGTEASLAPLAQAAHDNDPEVQIRAADGIVNFYVPGYVAKGALSGPLVRGVRQVRAFFSARNDQIVDPDMVVRPEVAAALADEVRGAASTDARANAARAAGILRDQQAVPALEDALRSRNTEIIFESLVALDKIKDPAGGPSVSFLAHDLDDRVQSTALETIGSLHSLSSEPDVRSALSNARNSRIRRAALECLALLGMPGDRSIFQQYASDKDPELRSAALEGLGRIREPEDYPALEAAYNEANADWRVHLAAAFALVAQGKVEISDFSPLQYLVDNLGTRNRASVANAYLTELCRREDVRAAVFPIVKNCTRDEKVALCGIFASSGSADVVPALNSLAKDIDPDVSLAAARGLRIVQARKT